MKKKQNRQSSHYLTPIGGFRILLLHARAYARAFYPAKPKNARTSHTSHT